MKNQEVKIESLPLGIATEMWVVSVIENRRQFTSGNARYYVHDIRLKDDEENYYQPEYVSRKEKLDHFVVGEKARFRVDKSRNSGHRSDEIIPYKEVGDLPELNKQMPIQPINTSVAGTSYSQALMMATQIKCAELTSLGEKFTQQSVTDLADYFDSWLLNKKEQYAS